MRRIAGLMAGVFAGLLGSLAPAERANAQTPEGDGARLPLYDLEDGRAVRLTGALAEVSGLALDADGALIAHEDERGILYVLGPADGAVLRRVVIDEAGLRGDFEGVARVGERIFLATSGGTLVETALGSGGAAPWRRHDTGLGSACELEGLAYDPAARALLVPCKVARAPRYQDRLVVFAVPLATLAPDPEPRVDLPLAALRALGVAGDFRPSALDVHPESGSLFILSARDPALVEVAADGRPLAARRLRSRDHPQAEGLAFGPGLELWIADEGDRVGPTLTRYEARAW